MLRYAPTIDQVQSCGLEWLAQQEIETPWLECDIVDGRIRVPSIGFDMPLNKIFSIHLMEQTKREYFPQADGNVVPLYKGWMDVKRTSLLLTCPDFSKEKPLIIGSFYSPVCHLVNSKWSVDLIDEVARQRRADRLRELYDQLYPPIRRNEIVRACDDLSRGTFGSTEVDFGQPAVVSIGPDITCYPTHVEFKHYKKGLMAFFSGLLNWLDTSTCRYSDVIVSAVGDEYWPVAVNVKIKGFPDVEYNFTREHVSIRGHLLAPIVKAMTARERGENGVTKTPQERLKVLSELLQSGSITKDEHDAKKQEILKEL